MDQLGRFLVFLLVIFIGHGAMALPLSTVENTAQKQTDLFMKNVGWGNSEVADISGQKIQPLLYTSALKSPMALNWLIKANKYFASTDFKDRSINAKRIDIVNAKTYAKIAIRRVLKVE